MKTILVGFFTYGLDKDKIFDENTVLIHTEKSPNNYFLKGFLKIVFRVTNYYFDLVRYNKNITSISTLINPDIIIFHKNLALQKSTIKYLKRNNVFTVLYLHDFLQNPVNRSINFLDSLQYFDLIITTKSYELSYLKLINQNVYFINNFINNTLNKTKDLIFYKDFDEKELVFIGGYEEERYRSLVFLADNGVRILIYAGIEYKIWYKNFVPHVNIKLVNRTLRLSEYYEVIQKSFLIYSPLRKSNKDLQTSRTVEIPYFGGILFTERTSEHLEMFEENREAIFFETDNELLEKYQLLIDNPDFYNELKLRGNKRAKCHNQDKFISLISQYYSLSVNRRK